MKLWKWWMLVVLAISGPWYGLTRAPQWDRVTWIPFHGFEDKARDVAANFLLYVPFGLSYARDRRGRSAIGAAVLAGFALSLAAEGPQLFYRWRDPSATDVLMAICGTAAGSIAAQAFEWRDARRTAGRGETGERCCQE